MEKTTKKTTDREKAPRKEFRFAMEGYDTKFHITNFQTELLREMFYFGLKCYEKKWRGGSPNSVAEREIFKKFRGFGEGLELEPLTKEFLSLEEEKKKPKLRELVDKLVADLAKAMSHGTVQDVDVQADYPDDMQVGEGSGPDPASEGVANKSTPPDESSLQNVPLGSVRSVGSPGVPPDFTLDLGSGRLSQIDNTEGRLPPSSRQCPDELNQAMSDMECRASRYPDMLSEFERLKQQVILFENKLKDREMMDPLSREPRRSLRSSLDEIPPPVPEGILAEDPQNQLSEASMEGVDVQADYPDDMQVGEGSALLFGMTVREDVDMQVNNPGQAQVDEVCAAAPNPDLDNTLSIDASLQNGAWNQLDNSQGRPPPVPLDDLVLVLSYLNHRVSAFPGMLPKFEWSEESFRSFVNQLELLEALEDGSNTSSRTRQEEIFPSLDPSSEDPQNTTSTPEILADEFWTNFLNSPEV